MIENILGQSPEITHLLRTLPMIALSDASVLLYGETGTGKELVAQALHNESRRSDKKIGHNKLCCSSERR
jgi:transcriptional regulator with GAF, ATPase, and Fis domain